MELLSSATCFRNRRLASRMSSMLSRIRTNRPPLDPPPPCGPTPTIGAPPTPWRLLLDRGLNTWLAPIIWSYNSQKVRIRGGHRYRQKNNKINFFWPQSRGLLSCPYSLDGSSFHWNLNMPVTLQIMAFLRVGRQLMSSTDQGQQNADFFLKISFYGPL